MKNRILLLLFVFLFIPINAEAIGNSFNLPVPFTPQAPLAEWHDQRQQDGCEEAVAAMAMAWVGNEKGITKANWRLRILILSDFEYRKIGEYRDVSLDDMVNWLFKKYFNYNKVEIKEVKLANDIVKELERGRVVLTPMNGQLLKNPYFVPPGPARHMILIKGYDYETEQFIVNDPGTRRGESYRYPAETIIKAIRAYSTGYHEKIDKVEKKMIVIEK